MCGRYRIKGDADRFEQDFNFLATEPLDPYFSRVEIRPTDAVPVILGESAKRCANHLRWGLIPAASASEPKGPGLINARAETLFEKPSFKDLVRLPTRRCTLPADGFYEWAKAEDPKQRKQAWLFSLPEDRPFAFAGLWDTWMSPESGHEIDTCTLITTSPSRDVIHVHDRMPAIFAQTDELDAWLFAELKNSDLSSLLGPLPTGTLNAQPVDLHKPNPDRPTLF